MRLRIAEQHRHIESTLRQKLSDVAAKTLE